MNYDSCHWSGREILSYPRDSITVDELTFALRWSTRRRTIGITLYPDGRMVVAAPVGCPRRSLEQTVRDKLPWVRRKLAQRAAQPRPQPRSFADGEEFHYLGRRHRLRLVESAPHAERSANGDSHTCGEDGDSALRLSRGDLVLPKELAPQARSHLAAWYSAQAQRRLPARVRHYSELMQAEPSAVQVKDLGRRWGTCDAHGRVRLHWQIVLFPPRVGDYVVVHELAHLRELNHSSRFWSQVEAMMPDYRELKAWLRLHADEYAL